MRPTAMEQGGEFTEARAQEGWGTERLFCQVDIWKLL